MNVLAGTLPRGRRVAVAAVCLLLILGTLVAGAPSAKAAESYKITISMDECDVMAVGVTGTCITSLQTWLNIFSDANLDVDGYFGYATKRAVQDFQSRHGLNEDGRVGPHTRKALLFEWYDMRANSVETPRPQTCDPGTGEFCDIGEAVPGLNGGIIDSIICNGVGATAGVAAGPLGVPAGIGAGIACDVLLS